MARRDEPSLELIASLIEPAPAGAVRVDCMTTRDRKEDEVLVVRAG
jgi:hypothetical protein